MLGPMGVTPNEGTAAKPAQTLTVAGPEHYNQEMEMVLATLPRDIRVSTTMLPAASRLSWPAHATSCI